VDAAAEGMHTAEHVLEIVTPRTNTARLSAAEHLFGALGLEARREQVPVLLEMIGDAERRRFLVRTTSPGDLRRVAGQLAAAVRRRCCVLPMRPRFPSGIPRVWVPMRRRLMATLQLRKGEYLPLQTFDDRELDAAGHLRAGRPTARCDWRPGRPATRMACAGAAGRVRPGSALLGQGVPASGARAAVGGRAPRARRPIARRTTGNPGTGRAVPPGLDRRRGVVAWRLAGSPRPGHRSHRRGDRQHLRRAMAQTTHAGRPAPRSGQAGTRRLPRRAAHRRHCSGLCRSSRGASTAGSAVSRVPTFFPGVGQRARRTPCSRRRA
jgi:hypothetical protein